MGLSSTIANSKTRHSWTGGQIPSTVALLKWVYMGRLSVAIAIFIAASFGSAETSRSIIIIVAVAAILSLLVTGWSWFRTHILDVTPGPTFLYSQALFDVGLVTAVVHVTGGVNSDFASLYIPVIAVSAVTMPFTSSLLVTILAWVLYVADVVFWNPVQLSVALWMQIGVFVAVAVATGYLSSRVRVLGTARSELEQEMHRIRLEAGDILRQIGSGVVTVDGDGTLLFANAAAERLLGFSNEDFSGSRFFPFLRSVSPTLEHALISTQRERHRRVRLPGTVNSAERSYPIGVTTTLHEPVEGFSPSVTAIFTDISDQVRLEGLNRRTERLEAVAELSASLAHEIKNPLASIRSSVEQLGRSAKASDDDRSLATLVVRESDRLSRLLTEFLDFARVRMNESQPVDLRAVADAAVAVVREHPDCPDDAELTVTGQCDAVPGDPDLLHRVVLNLVLNAVQSSDGAPAVTVELANADLSEIPSGTTVESCVLLKVSDNGPGIAAGLLGRLFDPFVTGRGEGTGLGLSVVQRAVEAHRGLVFVDSASGKGTTFSIFLPRGTGTEVEA